jgi:hypothetical protein
MGSDYKVAPRSEEYIAQVAAACRRARPQPNRDRFDPIDFIRNRLMTDGVESVWQTRWALPKGRVHLELYDRETKWDPPAEVRFKPKTTMLFDSITWDKASRGETHETFVAAHEIGHAMLHDSSAKEFSSVPDERISFRQTNEDSAEWQAHIFAGHVLIPTFLVRRIGDHERLAFLCNAPDHLVAERLSTVRNTKEILHSPQVKDFCLGCGDLTTTRVGYCSDCAERA